MNLPFTAGDIDFLNRMGLSKEAVFDGRPFTRELSRQLSKRDGKELVFGSPCLNAGHRIRTRSGHCACCNPSAIRYLRTYNATANLYVAYSKSSNLLKIGITENILERERSLKSQRYGDAHDWRVVAFAKVERAGEKENAIKTILRKYRRYGTYFKDGHIQESTETFECSTVTMLEVFVTQAGADFWIHPTMQF